jgi:pimeloyl-ACP methyl ester carboxylesterase
MVNVMEMQLKNKNINSLVTKISKLTGRKRVRMVFILVFFFIVCAAIPSTFVILAKAERGVQDMCNQTIGLRKIYTNVLSAIPLTDIGICACQPTVRGRMMLEGGFETTYQIYEKGGTKVRPGILLVHGNVWNGQNLSTYRLVAYELAKRGFIVFTFDKIGFGKSDDPYGLGPKYVEAAHDETAQVRTALDYFFEHPYLDRNQLIILGHSGGITQALELGIEDDRVGKVVIWVAPNAPQDEEEYSTLIDYLNDKFRARYKLLYEKEIPEWFSWEMTCKEETDSNIIWDHYRKEEHKPIILVLGENDGKDAHPHVMEIFNSLTNPKELVYISRSNHYLNTAQSLRWVFYDRKMLNAFIDSLIESIGFAPQ